MSTIIPPHFVKKLNKKYNLEERPYFFDSNSSGTGHCIRINPFKRTDSVHCQIRVPWCEEGYFNTMHIKPQSDPLFYAGCYCIQDASSMFIAHMLKAMHVSQSPIKILDTGGSGVLGTLLVDNTHPESLIVVNENNPSSSRSLISSLEKWGNSKAFVSRNATSIFSNLPAYFDMVLVYPSTMGTRQQRKGTGQSQTNDSFGEREQQRHVLTHSLTSLKNDGTLIYATHSATEEENEEMVNWLCTEHFLEPISIKTEPSWGIEEKKSGKRTIGSCFKNSFDKQAFFVTALRKKNGQKHVTWSNTNSRPPLSGPDGFIEKWIKADVRMCTIIKNKKIHLFPKSLENDFRILHEHLTLKKTGTCMGEFAGDRFIPHESLAFSKLLHPGIARKALSKEESLHFIKKKNPYKKEENTPPTLLTYEGFGLGWT